MKYLQKKNSVRVIAYCIMTNHSHMLINAENIEDLSQYMHNLNMIYAMYYNRINGRVGYVFRDRFRSEGIYSREELYNCIRYIYNNPVKAHMVDSPEKYEFSNYNNLKKYITENQSLFDDNFKYIEVEERTQSDEEIIHSYILKNKIPLGEIIKNTNYLKEIVLYLKSKNFSYRKMEKLLGVSREKLRKIIK